jgi:hypothetical protein
LAVVAVVRLGPQDDELHRRAPRPEARRELIDTAAVYGRASEQVVAAVARLSRDRPDLLGA